jgi:hypothetical protein
MRIVFLKVVAVLLPIALVTFFVFLGTESVSESSPTRDEPFHFTRGAMLLGTGDYRLNTGHPIFGNVLAALPTVFNQDLILPDEHSRGWWEVYVDRVSDDLINVNQGRVHFVQTLLNPSRYVMVGATAVFLLAFYFLLLTRFSVLVAATATVALAFSPTWLAHSRLVTTDIPVAITVFLATFALFRFTESHNRTKRIVWFVFWLIAALAAILSKYSAVAIAPVWLAALMIDLFLRNSTKRPLTRFGLPVLAAFLVVLFWVGGLTAAYGWQFETLRTMAKMGDTEYVKKKTGNFGEMPLSRYVYDNVALPFPQYVYGFDAFLLKRQKNSVVTPHFFLGQTRTVGWYYHATAMLLKENLAFVAATLAALLYGVVAIFRGIRRHTRHWYWLLLLAVPLWFFLLASASSIKIGIRHVLPVYPFLALLVGYAANQLVKQHRPALLVVVAACAAVLIGTTTAFPNYLSYYNELVGGGTQGWRYIQDSNFDWGQNELVATQFESRHNAEKILYHRSYLNANQYYIVRLKQLYGEIDARHDVSRHLQTLFQRGELQPHEIISNTHWVVSVGELN